MSGGFLGILGALIQELSEYSLFAAYLAGPLIEEAMKPAGVYLLLIWRPILLTSRFYTAFLSAIGGLVFSILENIIYLNIYFPEHEQSLVVFRYTADLAMHVVASFIVGLGINQNLIASLKGEIPFLHGNKKFFVIAVAIHSLFNITVTLLDMLGYLDAIL